MPEQGTCERCGYISSQASAGPSFLSSNIYISRLLFHYSCAKEISSRIFFLQKWCKACVLLEGLNRGLPKLGIGRTKGPNTLGHEKDIKLSNGTSSLESKQCGSLDF